MKKLLLLVSLFSFYSCGEISMDTSSPLEYSMDGVKLISSEIKDSRDEFTMKRSFYHLNESHRLLIRFEEFKDHTDTIIVDEENKVMMKLKIMSELRTGNTIEDIKSEIKVCPLEKNWMMLATWTNAHPFPSSESKWNNPGGDYDEADCYSHSPDEKDTDEKSLNFDISNWFTHSVRSRGKNYGFVVISSIPVQIYGDTHTSYAPKMSWNQSF